MHTPHNDFTRLIEEVSAHNAGHRSAPVSAGALPTVRSAAMGRDVPPPPLTPEEQAELDAKARAIGAMPPDENAAETYGTLEEAIAASLPPDAVEVEVAPVMHPVPTAPIRRPLRPGRVIPVGGPVAQGPSRLPDFANIQGIDLQRDVVYIDGLAFKMPEADVRQLRAYAIDLAQGVIFEMMRKAAEHVIQSSGTENKDGATTAVPSVQAGEGTPGVQNVGTEGPAPEATVPNVPQPVPQPTEEGTPDPS